MYNNPFPGYQMPYFNYQSPSAVQVPALQQEQVTQVNGKASVDQIQLAPNSSKIVMDSTAPIVWLCVSDGVGRVTATPYDITEHKDAPPVDVSSLEARLASVEAYISKMMEEKQSDKPNASAPAEQRSYSGNKRER